MKSADAGSAVTFECPLFFSLALGALSMVAVAAFRSFLFMVISYKERGVIGLVRSGFPAFPYFYEAGHSCQFALAEYQLFIRQLGPDFSQNHLVSTVQKRRETSALHSY